MTEHQHDEHCGCGEDHEEVFIVTDENGVEHEMVMVYTFESEEQVYAVLLDRENPDSDGVIFRIEEEGDEAMLVSIEEDEEWNRVVAIYNQIIEEENQD